MKVARVAYTTVLCAVLVLVAIGCNKGKRHIEEAKKQHDAGQLYPALSTLQKVAADAPGSPEVDQAKVLAVEWLVAEADKPGVTPDDKIKTLKNALGWDATSGAAQARLCVVLAEKQHWEPLRKCLNEEMKGKVAAPPDLVAKAKKALDERDRKVAEQAEVTKLFKSEDLADWRTLVTKYPQSTEAGSVKDKLEKAESICRDYPAFSFVEYLAEIHELIKAVAQAQDKFDKGEIPQALALGAIGGVGKTTAKEKGKIEAQCQAFQKHAVLPGEEKFQQGLAEDCGQTIKVYDKLYKAIDNYAGLAPFMGIKSEATRVGDALSKRGVKRTAECLSFLGSRSSAPEPATSGSATPAAPGGFPCGAGRCQAGQRCCPGAAKECVTAVTCGEGSWTELGFLCDEKTNEPCAGGKKCQSSHGFPGPRGMTAACR